MIHEVNKKQFLRASRVIDEACEDARHFGNQQDGSVVLDEVLGALEIDVDFTWEDYKKYKHENFRM